MGEGGHATAGRKFGLCCCARPALGPMALLTLVDAVAIEHDRVMLVVQQHEIRVLNWESSKLLQVKSNCIVPAWS